jgi:predicted nucleic acid-binding protein
MNGSVFFDTTILIYAVSDSDPRAAVAENLLATGGHINVQVLNEFAAVARRKLAMSWDEIAEALTAIRALCEAPAPLTVAIHEHALELAALHHYHIYDALLLAAAIDAGCAMLYSEDMQDGHTIGPVTIRNPFAGNLSR